MVSEGGGGRHGPAAACADGPAPRDGGRGGAPPAAGHRQGYHRGGGAGQGALRRRDPGPRGGVEGGARGLGRKQKKLAATVAEREAVRGRYDTLVKTDFERRLTRSAGALGRALLRLTQRGDGRRACIGAAAIEVHERRMQADLEALDEERVGDAELKLQSPQRQSPAQRREVRRSRSPTRRRQLQQEESKGGNDGEEEGGGGGGAGESSFMPFSSPSAVSGSTIK